MVPLPLVQHRAVATLLEDQGIGGRPPSSVSLK